jgi:mRNA-degrading endonuclease RelE of RelBE toxin-antitoxin system
VYRVLLTESAWEDLRSFRRSEQRIIADALGSQLEHEPMTETRNRKLLDPNPIATWALRVREYRVFYDVSQEDFVVTVRAVGRKRHNDLYIRGQRIAL